MTLIIEYKSLKNKGRKRLKNFTEIYVNFSIWKEENP